MKKIAIASLLALSSSMTYAADAITDPQLVSNGTAIPVLTAEQVTNDAQNLLMKKATDNKGFVKHDFNFTVSANVAMTVADSGRAFGVATASPKGRNVYTGLSEGGSIKECGDQTTAKKPATDNLDRFDMKNQGACNENPQIEEE